ncbi:MAG: hypothetical protein MJZ67_01875 [Bacteroidales bacterium]|nr:hypothetical protein [Bacteroidales bacterium]
MKHIHLLAAGLLALAFASCGSKNEIPELRTQQDTISYAMGMSIAETATSGIYDFDYDIMLRAIKATLDGKQDQPLSREAYQEACAYLAFLTTQSQRAKAQSAQEQADKDQEAYFAKLVQENPNVKKSPDGYYYEVLVPGSGRTAPANHRISFEFKSFEMISGRPLVNSYEDEGPIIHNLSTSIFPGLYKGFQTMRAGSKYRFYFPYQLAQNVPDLPAYTPVIYEVELIDIFND